MNNPFALIVLAAQTALLVYALNEDFKRETAAFHKKIYDMGLEETLDYIARHDAYFEGLEEKNRVFVKNLLTQTKLSETKIAQLAEVPRKFVRKIKHELHAIA